MTSAGIATGDLLCSLFGGVWWLCAGGDGRAGLSPVSVASLTLLKNEVKEHEKKKTCMS